MTQAYELAQAVRGLIKACESRQQVDLLLAALPDLVKLMADYRSLPEDNRSDV